MCRQKLFSRAFTIVLAISLSLPLVFGDVLPHIVQDTFRSIFGGMPQIYNQRAIMGLLLFPLLFFAVSSVIKPKESYGGKTSFKGVRVILALVLAFISAIGMPESILRTIFLSWGWVSGILFLLAPIVGFMYIAHGVFGNDKIFDQESGFPYGLKAVWFLLGMVFISQALAFLPRTGSWQGMSFVDVGELVLFGFFIMAIVYGIRAFTTGKGGGDDDSPVGGDQGSPVFNPFKGGGRGMSGKPQKGSGGDDSGTTKSAVERGTLSDPGLKAVREHIAEIQKEIKEYEVLAVAFIKKGESLLSSTSDKLTDEFKKYGEMAKKLDDYDRRITSLFSDLIESKSIGDAERTDLRELAEKRNDILHNLINMFARVKKRVFEEESG